MKNTRRILLFIVTLTVLFVTGARPLAFAQNENIPTGFSNVRLWVYPEYDDPRLLVMLEGTIVGATAPAQVRFLVPSEASMYSAGSMDAQGQYTGGPPDRNPSEIPGWDEISYTVTTNVFRMEYYDPLIVGQPDKTIDYEFRWLYPISDLEVIVQEPKGSSDFTVEPDAPRFADGEGFYAHRFSYTDLDDQPPLRFHISYSRSSATPSLGTSGGGGATSSPSTLLVIIALLVFCLALAGWFLWVRKPQPKTRADRRRLDKSQGRGTGGKTLSEKFCSNCGQSLKDSAMFCPYCGTKRK
ncbi:MAG: zinc ribbon domain-containing protein [Chloroflexota bacterium]